MIKLNKINQCNNVSDFRNLAKKKLPFPIFHYIDGGSDDEVTMNRNSKSFDECYLVPNVLRGVENIDLSRVIFGKKVDLPFFYHQQLYNGCFIIREN